MTDATHPDDPPEPFARGAFVHVTFAQRTITAMVTLASDKGHSLILMFEGILGGYVGMMPVLWQDGAYRDLVQHDVVVITPAASADDA